MQLPLQTALELDVQQTPLPFRLEVPDGQQMPSESESPVAQQMPLLAPVGMAQLPVVHSMPLVHLPLFSLDVQLPPLQ